MNGNNLDNQPPQDSDNYGDELQELDPIYDEQAKFIFDEIKKLK